MFCAQPRVIHKYIAWLAGEGETGRQLLHEARKHEELAADARRRANATAYGAVNQFLNRFKVPAQADVMAVARLCITSCIRLPMHSEHVVSNYFRHV